MKYVFNSRDARRYRFPTHVNELVIDRSQSEASEVFVVVLEPGEAPPLHKHDDTEQVFYIVEGTGMLRIGESAGKWSVEAGDLVRIPRATLHSIEAVGGRPLRYIAVDCFPGGRPSAEPTWDDHVRVMCREQGWDYGAIAEQAGSPSA